MSVFSLSNSQGGCGEWCVFCRSRPQFCSQCCQQPKPHPRGEFIFYGHVISALHAQKMYKTT